LTAEELLQTTVEATVFDGRFVYPDN
jgi:hypothetical protein